MTPLTLVKQWKYCLGKNAEKLSKYKHFKRKKSIIYSVIMVKPVFEHKTKIRQYDALLKNVKIDFDVNSRFLYWLDPLHIPFNRGKVIDNMPLNYYPIVNGSLRQLIEQKKASNIPNAIQKQDQDLLHLIGQYIDRICDEIRKKETPETKEQCKRHLIAFQGMKSRKAQSVEEALQRILFWNQILWQTNHTLNGLGRLDKILDRCYQQDSNKTGIKDILKDFLITLHRYYEFKSSEIMGDTGQLIILGGCEVNQSYFYNDLTFYFIDACEEVHLPDPKLLLRVDKNTPDKLLEKAVKCIASGIGSPLLSNDSVVIDSLIAFGYDRKDACNYVTSACWEPLSYGNSLEQNNLSNIIFPEPLIALFTNKDFDVINNMQTLLARYEKYLGAHIKEIVDRVNQIQWETDPIFTLFTANCAKSGKDISAGGAKYNDYGLLSIGIASTVNSILNIDKYVFKDKVLSLSDVAEIIEKNYEGYEAYQKIFSNLEVEFGCDCQDVVKITQCLMDATASELNRYMTPFGGRIKFGLSSPSYISASKKVGATLDGRRFGEPFSTHISASYAIPFTEIISFAASLDYHGLKTNGNVVDIFVQPSFINNNFDKFVSFVRQSINLGFFQLQFNVVSCETLMDAKVHPEKHKDLIVRVWGFSAYFDDLPEEYKDKLIERARRS